MTNFSDNLNKIISKDSSGWKEKAQFRKANPWLKQYSSEIARRILSIIENKEKLNQTKLAETLNVSPQQISKIVKGKENLTLETIYKLSKALNFELITFPEYKYSTILNQTSAAVTEITQMGINSLPFMIAVPDDYNQIPNFRNSNAAYNSPTVSESNSKSSQIITMTDSPIAATA